MGLYVEEGRKHRKWHPKLPNCPPFILLSVSFFLIFFTQEVILLSSVVMYIQDSSHLMNIIMYIKIDELNEKNENIEISIYMIYTLIFLL